MSQLAIISDNQFISFLNSLVNDPTLLVRITASERTVRVHSFEWSHFDFDPQIRTLLLEQIFIVVVKEIFRRQWFYNS